jgi:peptide/nickel transport system substrate-binding protein
MKPRLGLALIAITTALSTPSFAQEKSVTIAVSEEPTALEPCAMSMVAVARVIFGNSAEGLTELVPDTGQLKPLLATEWKQASPLEWDFKIREGVKYQDGTPFDANTAAKSITRAFAGKINCSSVTQIFGGVKVKAEAVSPTELKVTTDKLDPLLPRRMSYLGMTAPSASNDKPLEDPNSTGPYKLAKWDHGTQITLVRNPNYWGAKPVIDKVTYLFRSEDSVRADMVDLGEADMALTLPPDFGSRPGAVQFPVRGTIVLRMDALTPPLSDKRVRDAITMAFDRKLMVKAIWDGAADVATQVTTPDVAGYNKDIPPVPFDPAKAKALVASAKADGAPVNAELTIYNRTGLFANSGELSEVMASNLRDIGLNVKVQTVEAAPWVDILRTQGVNRRALLLEEQADHMGDAAGNYGTRYPSSQSRAQTPLDLRPTFDALFNKAAEASGEPRAQYFRELAKWVGDNLVMDAFIVYPRQTMMVGPRIEYKPNVRSSHVIRLNEIKLK